MTERLIKMGRGTQFPGLTIVKLLAFIKNEACLFRAHQPTGYSTTTAIMLESLY